MVDALWFRVWDEKMSQYYYSEPYVRGDEYPEHEFARNGEYRRMPDFWELVAYRGLHQFVEQFSGQYEAGAYLPVFEGDVVLREYRTNGGASARKRWWPAIVVRVPDGRYVCRAYDGLPGSYNTRIGGLEYTAMVGGYYRLSKDYVDRALFAEHMRRWGYALRTVKNPISRSRAIHGYTRLIEEMEP